MNGDWVLLRQNYEDGCRSAAVKRDELISATAFVQWHQMEAIYKHNFKRLSMPVNQNDSMSATAIIGYHLYISHDLNTLKACNVQVTH